MSSALELGSMADVNGVSTHYHEAGVGEPVLLLHGSGPGVSAWANWRLNLEPLAERFRVLALDVVGYGFTQRPEGIRYSVGGWIDHILGFMDVMGLERAHLVGNSMGGRLALGMAHEHPERVNRLVLMGSGGVKGEMTAGLKALRSYEPSEQAMRHLITECFAYDGSVVTDDLVRARYEASVLPGAHEAYRSMFVDPDTALGDISLTAEVLQSVTERALVIHGFEDKVIPVENAWNLLRLLPNAQLHVFKQCGHWTQLEFADEFNRLVGDFLCRP